MFIGILSGLLAGAFWGFSFLVPKVLGNFSPSEVALGRFGFYGIVSSIFLIFHNKNSLKLFKKPYIRKAFVLCLTGNTLYYFLLIYCIRFAGIPYASLCIGMIPVTTVLFSGEKNVRKLLFPLALIVCGILLVSFDLFLNQKTTEITVFEKIVGLLLGPLALCSWSYYAIQNSNFLKQNKNISAVGWTNFLGFFSLITIIPIYLIESKLSGTGPFFSSIDSSKLAQFLLWTAVIGIGSSWIATWLWNIASDRLPTSLSGQLIVSETIFSLLYGFVYDQRLPSVCEAIAIPLLLFGVFISIRKFNDG